MVYWLVKVMRFSSAKGKSLPLRAKQKLKTLGVVPVRELEESFFLSQTLAGKDAYRAVATYSREELDARQLSVLYDTEESRYPRYACFPTAVIVAVNFLSSEKLFGLAQDQGCLNLGDLYRAGIESHLNDLLDEDGKVRRRGMPSFDRRTGNMYHSFAVNFCRRFGIEGLQVYDFRQTESLRGAVACGAVVLLSVDNQFIPQVSSRGRNVRKLKTSRHLIIVHGLDSDGDFIYTDVFNPQRGQWKTTNLKTRSDIIDDFLLSPKMPHIGPRATVLFTGVDRDAVERELAVMDRGQLARPRPNAILSYKPELDFSVWIREIQKLRRMRDLTPWELHDYCQSHD